MRLITYIFLLLIVLLGITFAYLNSTQVVLNYYFGISNIALSLLLVVTLAIGISLGLAINLITYIRLKGENLRFQRKIKLLDKELTELRLTARSSKDSVNESLELLDKLDAHYQH
jgi:putative membrane protein